MSEIPTITINMDAKCPECGKGGATGNGVCMACTSKAIRGGPMNSAQGKAAQRHVREVLNAAKKATP